MAEHWMQKAFAKNKGKFTAKAKAAGEGVQEYAAKEKDAGGKLGKEANLALTAKKVAKSRKEKRYG